MTLTHTEPATTIAYILDADTQIAASRGNLWRYLRSRRAWIRMAIGVPVMILIGGAVGVALDGRPWDWMFMVGIEALVVFPVLYLVLFLLIPRRVRRLVAQSTIWDRPVDVTWSSAGLSSRSVNGTTELAWSDYHGWHQAKSGFLLYFNDQQYQVVPSSALAPDQAIALHDTLLASGLRRL